VLAGPVIQVDRLAGDEAALVADQEQAGGGALFDMPLRPSGMPAAFSVRRRDRTRLISGFGAKLTIANFRPHPNWSTKQLTAVGPA
jgi:hypothetical protein